MGEKKHFIGYSLRQKLNEIAGRAKPLAAFILICSGIFLVGFLCGAETDIRRMVVNPDGKVKEIRAADIVAKNVRRFSYVSVPGTAFYDYGMVGSNRDTPRSQLYFLLVDPETLDAVMVLSSKLYIPKDTEEITVTGILTVPDKKVLPLMEEISGDLLESSDIHLSEDQILIEGDNPPTDEIKQMIVRSLAIWALFFWSC